MNGSPDPVDLGRLMDAAGVPPHIAVDVVIGRPGALSRAADEAAGNYAALRAARELLDALRDVAEADQDSDADLADHFAMLARDAVDSLASALGKPTPPPGCFLSVVRAEAGLIGDDDATDQK